MTGIAACCARNQRPCDGAASDQRDEIAPLHVLSRLSDKVRGT
jgi:hypothetical protein